MGIWLNAWAGDNGGLVMGRQQQPYRALVAYTRTDDDYSFGFFTKLNLDGTIIFPEIEATCLTTPHAMDAIVTKVDNLGKGWIFSLEMTPVKEKGKVPWDTGVHLFGITIFSEVNNSLASTIATVVVPSNVTIGPALSDNAKAVMMMLKLSRQRPPLFDKVQTTSPPRRKRQSGR